MRSRRSALLLIPLMLTAATAAGQGTGDGFLLKAPAGQVSFRGGIDMAHAGSDVFAFATRTLTLDRHDFRAATFLVDVERVLTPRMSVRFSVGASRSTTPSEFRDFVDNNRRPIEQRTQFLRAPLTASLKAYLSNHGRAIGHFAWVPSRTSLYVGGGGGVLRYSFEQYGDFIDFATTKVFTDRFTSKGFSPALVGFVGGDLSLTPRVALTAEGRYHWARSPLSLDFSQFAPIDLSGFSVTSGLSFAF